MVILTWNIQAGGGADGTFDLRRTIETLRALGPPDLICLQEVADGFAEVDGGSGDEQVALLTEAFPEHVAFFGPALDLAGRDGHRRRFGNMILARAPILQCFPHLLPRPPDNTGNYMQRGALEAIVGTPAGPLRITTSHLEYYSAVHRQVQVDRLRALHAEAWGHDRLEPPAGGAARPLFGAPLPGAGILCGDMNFLPASPMYDRLTAPFDNGMTALVDAWVVQHGSGRPHAPTCGVHDRVQWPEGPHCRDFVFVSEDLADRVEDVVVDLETEASDHQPVRITLRG